MSRTVTVRGLIIKQVKMADGTWWNIRVIGTAR